jgi:hypothetical protein
MSVYLHSNYTLQTAKVKGNSVETGWKFAKKRMRFPAVGLRG